MKNVASAYAYYAAHALGNRVRAILGRLRTPRYFLGFVLAAAYLWYFLVRPVNAVPSSENAGRWLRLGVQLFYLFNLLSAWIFGALGRGLIFREAEVELLFAAPLRRAEILLFKFLQGQFGLIVTALVFSVIIQRSLPSRPFHLLVPAIWLVGNAVFAHGVLANLTLRSLAARGGLGRLLAWVPGPAIVLVLFVAFWLARGDLGSFAAPSDLERLIDAQPLRVLLLPLRFLADFILVEQGGRFLLTGAVILASAALIGALVVAADHRFEDQAVKTARMMARIKNEGAAGLADPDRQVVKGQAGGFPRLAALGPTWRALVWKNVISVGRLPRATVRILLILVPIFIAVSLSLRDLMSEGRVMVVLSFVFFAAALYGSLLGPALLRVDLRLDIPHFDLLKSLPIRGRDLLLGEVLGPCLLVFGAQAILVALGTSLFPAQVATWFDWRLRVIGYGIALPFLFALDFALFTLENLMALHLPSFVRFGRGLKAGFDQFGQNLLGAIVRGLALALMLIPSFLVGGGLGLVLRYTTAMPIELVSFIGVNLGAAVLVGAAYLLLVLSEARYESFDLSAESLGIES